MSIALILELISFGLTEAPVAIADIQQLVNLIGKLLGTVPSTPTQDEIDLVNAVAARKAAAAAMPK